LLIGSPFFFANLHLHGVQQKIEDIGLEVFNNKIILNN